MLRDTLQQYVGQTGGLLQGLLAVQSERGFLPPNIESLAADVFNVSRAEVKGVIGFYADLTMEPPKKVTVRVCEAEACQAVGSRALKADLEKGLAYSGADVAIEPVFCLGLCSVGPAVQVNDKLVGRAELTNVGRHVVDAMEQAK
ncbi:MAG: NAD(P)H-dependent oxidoreductase subunit E [Kordiimonadaceae bacterium]|nr:NAD(P)H-dependent oxidoreductase subunit E [Kordiimonadaceae bacterium]MBO6568650.1 NAD(P)H-dependent oxidoreductase subunit E [Kordiimonadaceae bacterium]MBO6965374.1 NAD(P)H-dependent oxidoreductase subunit E [Kordiimonadaceae bacterium]